MVTVLQLRFAADGCVTGTGQFHTQSHGQADNIIPSNYYTGCHGRCRRSLRPRVISITRVLRLAHC